MARKRRLAEKKRAEEEERQRRLEEERKKAEALEDGEVNESSNDITHDDDKANEGIRLTLKLTLLSNLTKLTN